jgi:Carboxypeptidase regulatory-like domain
MTGVASQRMRRPLRTVSKFARSIGVAWIAVFAFTVVAHAQDAAGSLEGHIGDRSGAIVAKANVMLKNVETNAVRGQVSDSDGLYRFVQLPVGRYLLTVEAPGFARFSQSSIEITVEPDEPRRRSSLARFCYTIRYRNRCTGGH